MSEELITIYRVQDAQGRGPYRPGFSMQWSDDTDPTIPEEQQLMFSHGREVVEICRRLNREERHRGFGFRTVAQLQQWFSGTERQRLKELGFRFVRLDGVRLEMESAAEVLFSTEQPLNFNATPLPLLN